MIHNEDYTEYSELLTLVASDGWRQYLKVLEKRKEYLQGKVNDYVSGKQWEDAYAMLACKKTIDKNIEELTNRLNELKGEHDGR